MKVSLIISVALLGVLTACEMRQTQTTVATDMPADEPRFEAVAEPKIADFRTKEDMNQYRVKLFRPKVSSRRVAIYRGVVPPGQNPKQFEPESWTKISDVEIGATEVIDGDVVAASTYIYQIFGPGRSGNGPLFQSLIVEIPLDRVVTGAEKVVSSGPIWQFGRLLFDENASLSVPHTGTNLAALEAVFLPGSKIVVHYVEGLERTNNAHILGIDLKKARGKLIIEPENPKFDAILADSVPPPVEKVSDYKSLEVLFTAEKTNEFSVEVKATAETDEKRARWRRYLSDVVTIRTDGESALYFSGVKIPFNELRGTFQGPKIGEETKALIFSRELQYSMKDLAVTDGQEFFIELTSTTRLGGAVYDTNTIKLMRQKYADSFDLEEVTYTRLSALASPHPKLAQIDELERNIAEFNKNAVEGGCQAMYWVNTPMVVTTSARNPSKLAANQLELMRLLVQDTDAQEICKREGVKQITLLLYDRAMGNSIPTENVTIPSNSTKSAEQIWLLIQKGERTF